jgi:hypothetical protein
VTDETNPDPPPLNIRLMNEYGYGPPLWPDVLDDVDPEDLFDGLSKSLQADLMAFVNRWDANVSPEVYDDRWDGVPVMMQLVAARYALGRLLHPGRERAAVVEDQEMRRIGEELRVRLQQELGPGYRVTYVHG